MKFKLITIIAICTILLLSFTNKKTIELPLNQHNGYGYFIPSMNGLSSYDEDDENNPLRKTYLKVTGVPESWTNVKYGDIETNVCQTLYQNYHLGNIPKELYELVQKRWDWKPDSLQLSKEPLKTKIAFAYSEDSTGVISMIVDANNNLDFSDDEVFSPLNHSLIFEENRDSIAMKNSIDVTYERFIGNKIVTSSVPIFIEYRSNYNMFMCNFQQYSTTNFKGVDIAVNSGNFTDLAYEKPTLAIINNNLKKGDKFKREEQFSKNEYIEINNVLYKNLGVNTNKNALLLEKMELTKNEMHSTQIGFKTFPFAGHDVKTESPVSLDNLKGKYVLLDFWAVWCGPCLSEIPALKDLYKKTDKDKFEIIGIVGDSSADALKKIIEKDSITWPQILSTESNKIKEVYGISGYPTTYLIDPEGIIIEKNLRGVQLEGIVLDLIKK